MDETKKSTSKERRFVWFGCQNSADRLYECGNQGCSRWLESSTRKVNQHQFLFHIHHNRCGFTLMSYNKVVESSSLCQLRKTLGLGGRENCQNRDGVKHKHKHWDNRVYSLYILFDCLPTSLQKKLFKNISNRSWNRAQKKTNKKIKKRPYDM